MKTTKDIFELKLKKLCTYYRSFTSSYSYKITGNTVKVYKNSEYNYSFIELDGLDDLSYKMIKNYIKSYYFKSIFDNKKDSIATKCKKTLEKLGKTRSYKTTFELL